MEIKTHADWSSHQGSSSTLLNSLVELSVAQHVIQRSAPLSSATRPLCLSLLSANTWSLITLTCPAVPLVIKPNTRPPSCNHGQPGGSSTFLSCFPMVGCRWPVLTACTCTYPYESQLCAMLIIGREHDGRSFRNVHISSWHSTTVTYTDSTSLHYNAQHSHEP